MKQLDRLERYEEEIRADKHQRPWTYFALMIVMIVFATFGFMIKGGFGEYYTDTERTICMWIAILSLFAAAWLFILFLVAMIGKIDRSIDKPLGDQPLDGYLDQEVGPF